MTGPSRQIGIGRPSFLTEHQKTDLYGAALRILAEIGMRLHHEEARSAMLDAGCTLDDDGRVHVPATVIDAARATAPASFTVFDRAGEPAMEVGGYNAYFGTGSDLMHLYDLETG
jgi:trimethylamine--corrinoid protein Co-methyltransferase